MKKFQISGFIMLKGQGNTWQPIKEGLVIKVPRGVNEYELACQQFGGIADNWLITLDEIEEE